MAQLEHAMLHECDEQFQTDLYPHQDQAKVRYFDINSLSNMH